MSNSQASDPIDHKEKLELKLYTTKLTYSELQALAMDIRRGNANHDDNVIAEWIKVTYSCHQENICLTHFVSVDDDLVGERAERSRRRRKDDLEGENGQRHLHSGGYNCNTNGLKT